MSMAGVVWALIAGVGFGVFQSLNRRAVKGMDVYLATFLQLLVSALVLAVVSLLTVDMGLLRAAPAGAYLNFALAGFFHFFLGWTLMNMSQKLIGAARTSPLTGTNPLFAVAIAAVALQEFPDWLSLVGIVLMVAGVAVISAGQVNSGAGRCGAARCSASRPGCAGPSARCSFARGSRRCPRPCWA
jgi:drug/metabolite transporter (DMT)-like permease